MTKLPIRYALMCTAGLLAITACGSDADTSAGDATDADTATTAAGTATGASPLPVGTVPMIGAGFPVTVETCGTVVTIDEAPDAVVTGWPTIIATLDALGVGDSVIGYTSADLATAPPTAAEPLAPDFRTSREVMIASGLDMFIVNDENQIDASAGNLGWSDLTEMGAGAFVLGGYCLDAPAPTDLGVVYDDIEVLGAMFGVADHAADLNDDLREQVSAAAASVDDLAGSTAAVVQAYDGTLFALSGSYYAMIPTALGLESVFADLDGNFAEISPEEVLTLAPDVVIIVHEGDATAADAAITEVSDLLAASPAIQNERIATVENGVLSGGGVSVVESIVDVANQLQP